MTIDNIKNYLSEDKSQEFERIVNNIYLMTEHLNATYPGYKEWFFDKQVKGCYTPSRNIIFIKNENDSIVGISCLKKDDEERKICTLFVDPTYRKHGIGNILLEESIKFLETTKPLATLAEDKLSMFEKIIKKYDWKLTEIADDVYNKGAREFCFNGQLTKRDYRQELLETLRNLKKIADEKLELTDTIDKISVKK